MVWTAGMVRGERLSPADRLLGVKAVGEAFHIDPGGRVGWQTWLRVAPELDVIARPWGGFAMTVLTPRSAVCVYEP